MIPRPAIIPFLTLLLPLFSQAAIGWSKSAAATGADDVGDDPNVKHRELRGITEKTVPLRQHSLYAPYVDFDLQNRWFDFGGSAIINTNKHIRLTQDRKSQSGWLWSRQPLTQDAFEVEVEFKIDGESNSLYGDGLAIWLSKQPEETGNVFGSRDFWEGVGIFIDTYPNSRHSYTFPRIMGIVNDGTKSYDVSKDGQGQEAGACSLSVRRADVATKAKVTYLKEQFLEVQIHHEKWDQWSHCFTIWNYTLPSPTFLGFTAHTGDVSDDHDIVSVSASTVVYHAPVHGSNRKAPGRSGRGVFGFRFFSWLSWLLKLVAILVCLVLLLLGVRGYIAKQKRSSLKRF